MSPVGPASTTRYTLLQYWRYMNLDGSNCFIGVRRAAVEMRLNKSTVAEHLASAIELGWLLTASPSRHSRRREVLSAVPDDISEAMIDELSGRARRSVSSMPGQSSATLSGLKAATVRVERVNRPARTDIPLIPILPSESGAVRPVDTELDLRVRQEHLLQWLLNNETAKKYADSLYALKRLAPHQLRFEGFEEFLDEMHRP